MNKPNARQSTAGNLTEPLGLKRTSPNFLRSRDKADHKWSDIWLITLSDLLLLLVIFFVVLFSMELQKRVPTTAAHAEAKETASAAKPEHAALNISASVEKDLASTLNTEKSEPEAAIKRDANVVVLTFPERIIFDPGQAQVKSSAQATLDKVADFIKERAYLIVEVQGHTDNQPINTVRYPSNWELSVDRATQVARALIGMGVNPLQLSVKGFGEYHCLYPNDSDENRLKNRRVEIQLSILPNEVQGKKTSL